MSSSAPYPVLTLIDMPTKLPRISVTCDSELGFALDEVARLEQTSKSRSSLLRDLALEGARSRLAEERRRHELLERFARRTTTPGQVDVGALEELARASWVRGNEP